MPYVSGDPSIGAMGRAGRSERTIIRLSPRRHERTSSADADKALSVAAEKE
jgi:hypothetical protein